MNLRNLIWKADKPELKIYKDVGGNSIVGAYELGPDFLKIHFQEDGRIIKYSYRTAGRPHVKKMKMLAEQGRGLGEYITEYMTEK